MRSFRHWTPRYAKNRLAEIFYQKNSPKHPWLTETANGILASYLKNSDIGLEFGSGRSTVWFAELTSYLTSIEHDHIWYEKVRKMLQETDSRNVDYRFIPKDVPEDMGSDAAYVRIIDTFDDDSLDYVLIDGAYRDSCALRVLKKICPGGVMVIDNANWYLPCKSFSPNSRTLEQGPNGPIWNAVSQSISDWRSIWTSSGVTDTAFYFRPS